MSPFKPMRFKSSQCRQQLQQRKKLPPQHSAEHHVCLGQSWLDNLSSASLTAPAYWKADRRDPALLKTPGLPEGSDRLSWFQLTFQFLASLGFRGWVFWFLKKSEVQRSFKVYLQYAYSLLTQEICLWRSAFSFASWKAAVSHAISTRRQSLNAAINGQRLQGLVFGRVLGSVLWWITLSDDGFSPLEHKCS